MAHSGDFFEVGGDQEHGDSRAEGFVQQGVDLAFGAHIDAGGGLFQDQHVGVGGQPPAENDLLLVASGQAGDR